MKEVIMPNRFVQYEEDYQNWKNSGYNGCKTETLEFIRHLLHRTDKQLWAHQKEAILRIIYLYEIKTGELENKYLLKIVTGGGKTVIISAIIGWLFYAHTEEVHKILILVPNLIVRDRLEYDFVRSEERKSTIFENWDITPDKSLNSRLNAAVLESGSTPQKMLEVDIVIANIQELYTNNVNTASNLDYILKNFEGLAIFNDEAHNTNANEFDHILKLLNGKTVLRIDTTATPERADGTYPNSNLIYDFDIDKALLADRPIIKDVVVYRPDTKLIEITYINATTGEKKKINELEPDFEEAEKRIKPFNWIMDDAPLNLLVDISLDRLREKEKEAKNNGNYKPILFIVTMGIKEAKKVQKFLEHRRGIKTLLVTEESDDKEREDARNLGKNDSPYKAVVSVFMLREGWDVPEVSVILLLRRILSPVFGQQIIGRGLRKINKSSLDRETLLVVDHPQLQHDWLWKKMRVTKTIEDVIPNQEIEIPKLPRGEDHIPRLVNPDNLIAIKPYSDKEFNEKLGRLKENLNDIQPDKDWRKTLDTFSYDTDEYSITKLKLESIRKKYIGKKFGEEVDYDVSAYSEADKVQDISIDDLKEQILSIVEYILEKYNVSETDKGRFYKVILNMVSKKFLDSKPLSQSTPKDRILIFNNLENLVNAFTLPVVKGIIEDGALYE
ncbi:MAG: DEAD/DEAH box helicase [Caldisphaera sp.]